MVDSPDRSDTPDGDGVGSEPETTTGMPRWVKVFGIIAIAFIVLVVLMLAGVFGGGHGPSRHMGGGHEENSPVAAGAFEVAVTADEFAFEPDEITVRPGDDVAIVLTSVDLLHDFTIDELDAHVAAERGETAAGGFRADRAGRYTFYCSEPGHREAGMQGTLIVAGGSAPAGGSGGHRPPAGGHG